MTMLQIDSTIQLDLDAILNGFTSLNTPELERVFAQVNKLLAQRKAPHLSAIEFNLLQEINQAIPSTTQARYTQLTTKLQDKTIVAKEHHELLQLIEQMEDIGVQRMKNLIELAQIRQTTVPKLMNQLGIKPPSIQHA